MTSFSATGKKIQFRSSWTQIKIAGLAKFPVMPYAMCDIGFKVSVRFSWVIVTSVILIRYSIRPGKITHTYRFQLSARLFAKLDIAVLQGGVTRGIR
jgi:hypothetical protein